MRLSANLLLANLLLANLLLANLLVVNLLVTNLLESGSSRPARSFIALRNLPVTSRVALLAVCRHFQNAILVKDLPVDECRLTIPTKIIF